MDRTAFLDQLHAQFAVPRPAVMELIQRVCGQKVAGIERLIHGDENEVYRADLAEGGTVFVRIGRPDTPALSLYREAWAMEHARRAGVPVPDVLTVEPIAGNEGDRHAMVVAAASGRQLTGLLPSMPAGRRAGIMRDLGRVLARLHAVSMRGRGMPDGTGDWPDEASDQRRYITNVIADCDHLGEAGLTDTEIQDARGLLHQALEEPVRRPAPVLCHGDLSPDHIFVDRDLRVRALIDWGMWSAGAAEDDLAEVAMRHTRADFDAVLEGHSGDAARDPALRQTISRALMMRTIAYLRWLLTSGQTGHLESGVVPLRRALTDLTRGN
ncbi:phosphotransferase [Actinopolymorpha sp. B9G3]|uniref:phosphotransferase family protein n=1 Tax=Actinopolymorpha sp. B9G3 TaxID=3158970 RepID=UPI0032D93295